MINNFNLDTYIAPGDHLNDIAKRSGIDPKSIMRDYSSAVETPSGLSVVVGDMANNLTGTTYEDGEHAAALNLAPDFRFNGGLLGSIALRHAMADQPGTGGLLVASANSVLSQTYERYGIGQGDVVDPAERFTGYLTHAKINSKNTVLTAVGDVNAWVNGQHVVGEEKAVDTAKEKLIKKLTDTLALDPETRITHVHNILQDFASEGRLNDELATNLYKTLLSAIHTAETPDRQTVYKPVDDHVTPWQIRTLQNEEPEVHPWAYGAIDGTTTPDTYIKEFTIPTSQVDSLVIATDGSQPISPDAAVHNVSDLQPVNVKFSEQTVLSLTRNA